MAQVNNTLATLVAGVGLVTAVTTGIVSIFSAYGEVVSHFHDIDVKLSSLEEKVENVERGLDEIDNKLEINNRRWAVHFKLWGESIERQGADTGVSTDVLRPE